MKNNKLPNILIINDDGIDADGIKSLWRATKGIANIDLVAPSSQRSGASLSMTLTKPLEIKKHIWENNIEVWSVNGTPVDCVKLYLKIISPDKKPDLIISGINKGSNAGKNVLYSGTIGGVIEGVFRNIPGIAFSSESDENPNFDKFEIYIPYIVQYFLKNPIPNGCFINVSFPVFKENNIKGFKIATQGNSFCLDELTIEHKDNIPHYWIGGKWLDYEEEHESDIALLSQGYITAVPIKIAQLTDFNFFDQHKNTFENLFESLSVLKDQ